MSGTWIGFRAGESGTGPSVRPIARSAGTSASGRTRGQGIRLEVSG